jgi:hypothetical protein
LGVGAPKEKRMVKYTEKRRWKWSAAMVAVEGGTLLKTVQKPKWGRRNF